MAAVDYAHQWSDAALQQQAPLAASYGVTPDYARSLTAPTSEFLCPIIANDKDIDFVGFRVRSLDEGNAKVLFNVERPEGMPRQPIESLDDTSRFIRYHFGPEFLDIRTVGTHLEFTVGDEPLHDFLMIERHYFRDVLINSYEFTMPFVIPGTRNTWEMIYSTPLWTDEWKAALISAPWETRSDSFFFVDGRLVMHNRAEYNYSPKY
jgi:hypothetical protein